MQHAFIEFLVEHDYVSENVAKQLTENKRYIREPIGMIAVNHGLLKPNEIDVILDHQRVSKARFGEIGVELGFLDDTQVSTLVKIQEFRAASDIAEALALSGVLTVEDAVRYLGAYLLRDTEVLAMMQK